MEHEHEMYEHELAVQFSSIHSMYVHIRDAVIVVVPLVGLATIESFRLVSHGCGVPASLRDEVRAAMQLGCATFSRWSTT
jgi:hypothetical protein